GLVLFCLPDPGEGHGRAAQRVADVLRGLALEFADLLHAIRGQVARLPGHAVLRQAGIGPLRFLVVQLVGERRLVLVLDDVPVHVLPPANPARAAAAAMRALCRAPRLSGARTASASCSRAAAVP